MPARTKPTIEVREPQFKSITVRVVGTQPFICNAMSEKAKRDLFLPSKKKTKAEKESSLKHDPIREFRDSFYRSDSGPTLIEIPSASFKGVMMTAALDVPGSSKSQIGRLVWVCGHRVPLYGVPQYFMAAVRSADASHTPDIRTRAILPRWASVFDVQFLASIINETTIFNLLATGSMTSGVGDFRPEKGKGTFGQFRLCNADDPEFLEIVKTGGRAAQQEAVDNPTPYDAESAELLEWFKEESVKRGHRSRGKNRTASADEEDEAASDDEEDESDA